MQCAKLLNTVRKITQCSAQNYSIKFKLQNIFVYFTNFSKKKFFSFFHFFQKKCVSLRLNIKSILLWIFQ